MTIKIEDLIVTDTPESFSKKIEDYVWKYDTPYFEAIMEVSKKLGYDEIHVASLLTPVVKQYLQNELEDLSLLKKSKKRKITDVL